MVTETFTNKNEIKNPSPHFNCLYYLYTVCMKMRTCTACMKMRTCTACMKMRAYSCIKWNSELTRHMHLTFKVIAERLSRKLSIRI